MAEATRTGPLSGMRVLELAHVMAGPTCGLMLADLGADVIKVERVPGGDDTRRSVPPEVNGESAAFLMMNRNKRGIALDLKNPQAREVLLRLVRNTDVLIENYRHDTMAKLGLGYDALSKINPALIYCEISGFGRTGPYAERGGFDLIAQGMSGLMSITGEGPGRPPVKVGAPVSDITAGILGALGCVSAYVERLGTGKGQRVDTSLFEAGITHTYWQSAIAFATGIAPGPMGSAHPLNAPYQAFATADGWITDGAANQPNWDRFTRTIGAPELRDDPRFKDNRGRMANLALLVDTLAPFLEKRTSADWLARFEAVGLPAGPVLSVTDMHADPQAQARAMIVETVHPKAGPTRAIGLPIKLSETPGGIRRPAPLFGQHTREVLGEAGYSAAEIDALAAAGAVVCSEPAPAR